MYIHHRSKNRQQQQKLVARKLKTKSNHDVTRFQRVNET